MDIILFGHERNSLLGIWPSSSHTFYFHSAKYLFSIHEFSCKQLNAILPVLLVEKNFEQMKSRPSTRSEVILGKITRHSRIRKGKRVGMLLLGGFALSVWRRSDGTVRLNLADFHELFSRIFPRSCRDLYVFLAQISRFFTSV
jgi:hypothetical protein